MAFRRHMKNFVKNYSESEVKVREATSNDPWGPSSSLMLDISDLTYNTVSLLEIMNMIWHRMNDQGKNWRHVYKSLTLLDYLIKNGSKKVIQHCREGLFNIQTLKSFHYIDEAGKDQGYHVREKSKQVCALLTDDKLLHNERKIARRTRRLTSYELILPKTTTTTKDYSPTVSASEPIQELPDSAKVQYHFPKAASVPQQKQLFQTPSKAAIAQEMMAPQIIAKKSSEDLIVFSEDELSPSTTTLLPLLPVEGSSDGPPPEVRAAASDSWNGNITPYPPQRSLSIAQKWGTGKRTDSTVTYPASTINLKPPSRNQSTNHPKTAEILLDQPSAPEKLATTSQWVPKSDCLASSSEASVETIYLSPTFNVFDTLGNNAGNNKILKPTPASSKLFPEPSTTTTLNFSSSAPGSVQTFNTNLHLSPRPDSTSSMATMSSFSISSPESVVPENTVPANIIPSGGMSCLSSPYKLSSSLFFNDLKDKVTHPFSCQISDEHRDNTSILNLLPDNSRRAGKVNSFDSRTLRVSGGSWGAFPVENVDSMANSITPSAEGSPNVGSTQKAMGTLEEIKNAVLGVRGDIGNVIQELQTIGSQMASLVSNIQHMSKFLTASKTTKDDPC